MAENDAVVAGTMESSDVYVRIDKGGGKLELEIESLVMERFGKQIEAVARKVLADNGITDAKVHLNDHGALDYVITARLETAIRRWKEAKQ